MQRKSKRRGRHQGRNIFLLALGGVVVTVLIVVASIVGYVLAVANSGPPLSALKPLKKGQTSLIYAADGSRLGYVQSDEIRTPVKWKSMPATIRNAVVAIEDERFYKHKGVDYWAIIRAGVKNIESGKSVQGGSTITQQLVRALYIKDPRRNFKRKIREAKLASELEKKHSKQWILKSYLNDVPFGTVDGRTAIGIEAAAQTFFNKHARDLTLAEAALLAGLPQAPSQYNPWRNPTEALQRRSEVLQKMAENNFITQSDADQASQSRLGLHRGTRYTRRREPYFFDYVQEKLIEDYGVGAYRLGGLKVYTTIDPKLQEAARTAIQGQLPNPADPSSAIVSIDPSTGYIRAMASSGHYQARRFNLAAQGRRQPGSAFKTFVLTTAIRQGKNPSSTSYTSRPLNLNVPGYGPWTVKTYGNSYGGSMNLVTATLKSDNTVYAQLIIDVGPKEVAKTAKMMGITTKLDGLPAEGLGGLRLGVSPLEMADAYATLASGGIQREATAIKKVVFPDGKPGELGKPQQKRVLTEAEAFEVTKILKMNVQGGTGTKANIGCPVAGKTGTTDKFNDAWFVGYTPKLVTSTWVGFPNALQSMPGVAGGTIPASIWHDYMVVAKGNDCQDFQQPDEQLTFTPFTPKKPLPGSTGPGGNYSGAQQNYYVPPQTGTGTGGVPNNQGGGQNYGGYDPRLYEAPPQPAPVPQPTPEDVPRSPRPRPAPPADTGGDPDQGAAEPGDFNP